MKSYARFIIESGINKRVIYTFARMNPISKGHELLIDKMRQKALQENADLIVFLSPKQDIKTNPLTADQKKRYFKLSFPDVNVQVVSEAKDPFKTTEYLINKGYNNLHFCCGSDRKTEYDRMQKYFIEKSGLTFESIQIYVAGVRTILEDVSGMSATKMREYVINEKFESFYSCCPSNMNVRFAREMYNDCKKGMNL